MEIMVLSVLSEGQRLRFGTFRERMDVKRHFRDLSSLYSVGLYVDRLAKQDVRAIAADSDAVNADKEAYFNLLETLNGETEMAAKKIRKSLSACPYPERRRKRTTFSSVEVENLIRGVERYGTGPWALIRDVYFSNSRRTNQDLWHKWRNLVEMKSADAIVTPQQLTRIAAANQPKLVALQEGYLEPVVEQEIDDLDVKTSVLTPTQRASIKNFVAQATVKTYLAHSELLDVMQLFDWFLVAKIDQGNDVAAEDYDTFHPLVVNLVNTTKAMMDNILDPIEGNTSNNNAGQDVDIADNVEEVATGSDSGAAIIVNEGVGATVSTSVATVGDGGNADTVEVATGSDDGAAIIVNEDVRATVSTSEATVGVDGGAATE